MSINDTLTIKGNVTEQGNLTIGGLINANGSFGVSGQALVSSGNTANAYWGTVTTNPASPNTGIQFNSNGAFGGDANLTWNVSMATISINGTISFPYANINSTNAINSQAIVINYTSNSYPSNGTIGGLKIENYYSDNTAAGGIAFHNLDDGGALRHGAMIFSGKGSDWVANSGIYPGYLSFYVRQSNGFEELALNLDANLNTTFTNGIIANKLIGTSGYSLLSGGNTGNAYWGIINATAAPGGAGANTEIIFNNSGVYAADANLKWNTTSAILSIGNSTVNLQINSTTFLSNNITFVSNNIYANGRFIAQSGFTSWFGLANSGNFGLASYSNSNYGIIGISNSGVAIYGNSISSIGVEGQSNTSTGTAGVSNSGWGVYGQSNTNWAGVFEPGNTGLSGGGSFSESSGTWNALVTYALGSGYGAYIQSNTGWILALANNTTETLHVYNDGTINAGASIISANVGTGGQFRAVGGNYGVMLRNDGANYYHLVTASGNQYGTWNSFRPYSFNLATGSVTIDGTGVGTTFGGNITVSGGTVTATTFTGNANTATNSSNSNHLFISGGGAASNWNWSGQGGQPSWLWGSNDGTNMYVWNASNFNVNSALTANNSTYLDGWQPSYSKATNGYILLPGGLYYQWNYFSSVSSPQTWTFPVAVTTVFSAQITPQSTVAPGLSDPPIAVIQTINTTAMIFHMAFYNGTASTTNGCYVAIIGA